MMFWNVTYNDPGRWREVYAVAGPKLGSWQAVVETLRGRPVGSPKLDVVKLEGWPELVSMRTAVNDRTVINFQRTQEGCVAFTKVRLEVYALPLRWSELSEFKVKSDDRTGQQQITLEFNRNGTPLRICMQGAERRVAQMAEWLSRSATSV